MAGVYICVATVLAQAIVLGVLWLKGGVSREKAHRMLAVVYDVRPAEIRAQLAAAGSLPDATDGGPTDDAPRARAVDQTRDEIRIAEVRLVRKRERYELLRSDFAIRLRDSEQAAGAEALVEVQRALEIMRPKQAKLHVLRMLDDGGMDDVVTIVKSMPLDKRKKLFAEFKTDDEAARLHEILREVGEVAQTPGSPAEVTR